MQLSISIPSVGKTGDRVLLEVSPGEQLSKAIWLSGRFAPVPLCGGLARCTRCRIRYLTHVPEALPAEKQLLSASELADGWRLACRRQVPDSNDGLELALPSGIFPRELSGKAGMASQQSFSEAIPLPDSSFVRVPNGLRLAVDLGTSFVVWRALAPDGTVCDQGSSLNPQAGAGADIMSRIAVAGTAQGLIRLSSLVRELLEQCICSLPEPVSEVVVAGNTAMTDIFLGFSVRGLAAAPYRRSHPGGESFSLPGFPPVYVPPLPGPFIGGDVSAGLALLLAKKVQPPFVLADLGTNGEIVLVDAGGRVFFTSVPLGPALEGIGPECGRMAGKGVITSFTLTPGGLIFTSGTGETVSHPVGISATGYLSLLAALLHAGFLSSSGRFPDHESAGRVTLSPLVRRFSDKLAIIRGAPRLALGDGIWLSAGDVEEILKVKAAFSTALEQLFEVSGVPASRLAMLYISGSLGTHVKVSDLEATGFVPGGCADRVLALGNTSLDGACLLALHPHFRKILAEICDGATLLEPARDPSFSTCYIQAMHFGE